MKIRLEIVWERMCTSQVEVFWDVTPCSVVLL